MSTVRAVIDELCRDGSRADSELTSGSELLSSGLLDSLGLIALVTWIEDSYAVSIEATDIVLDNFETPAAIASLIDQIAGASA